MTRQTASESHTQFQQKCPVSVSGFGIGSLTHQCPPLRSFRRWRDFIHSVNGGRWCPRCKKRISEANGGACDPVGSSPESLPFAEAPSKTVSLSPLPLNADCGRSSSLPTAGAVLRCATALRVCAPQRFPIRLIRGSRRGSDTRVLSVKKLNAKNINRYIGYLLAYYATPDSPGGDVAWIGGGARALGLTGQRIDTEALKNLLKGFDPAGLANLVRNAGTDDRMMGFDLALSAPKSFSYAWSIALPELRRRMEEIFHRAVDRTLSKIEADSRVRVRNGKGGRDRHEAQIIGVRMLHHTARPKDEATRPDAQLHAHTLLINTGFTKDGRTGALDGLRILNKAGKVGRSNQFALKYGQEFRDELARLTRQELGFDLRPTTIRGGGTGWELAGIPKSELSRNSKRAKQITSAAPENATPGQRRRATLTTRHEKADIEPSQLFAVWQSEARARGITPETIEALRTQHTREIERAQERERMRSRGLSR